MSNKAVPGHAMISGQGLEGGRQSEPSAVALDSHTLRYLPKRGRWTGHARDKHKKGLKMHLVVNELSPRRGA